MSLAQIVILIEFEILAEALLGASRISTGASLD